MYKRYRGSVAALRVLPSVPLAPPLPFASDHLLYKVATKVNRKRNAFRLDQNDKEKKDISQ